MNHKRKAFFPFAGAGGGALGFAQAKAEWRDLVGEFEVIGGFDVDEQACKDFEMFTGVPCARLDLFSREDYTAWHGHEPPDDWREPTPEDIRRAAGYQTPNVVFTSPPCKGLSLLQSKNRAESERYQALNRLVVRGIVLGMEAWRDNPPEFWIMENVPGLNTRGRSLLRQVKAVLESYGYAVQFRIDDLGEVGGLAQRRRRFTMVARHTKKVPPFLYQPPKRPLKAIGEVLGSLPFPGDPAGGPMHRLRKLDWITWLRLSLIRPGGDWRDIPGPGEWRLLTLDGREVAIEGARQAPDPAVYGRVFRAELVGGAKTADARLGHKARRGSFGVNAWDDPAGTVIAAADVRGSNGRAALADPRLTLRDNRHTAKYRVYHPDLPSGTVIGSDRVGSGAPSYADPRLRHRPRDGSLGVSGWEDPARTVTGNTHPTSSNGPGAVADPRLRRMARQGVLSVWDWAEPGKTVIGHGDQNGTAPSTADPRLGCRPHSGAYGVLEWSGPAGTIVGSADVHAAAVAVADTRSPGLEWPAWMPEWVIISPWGYWHRPLTDLELAVLQGFPATWHGKPLVLAGQSSARWRERIGNAVPPLAAQAIAHMMLLTLLATAAGDDWILSPYGTPPWVAPYIEEAMAGD